MGWISSLTSRLICSLSNVSDLYGPLLLRSPVTLSTKLQGFLGGLGEVWELSGATQLQPCTGSSTGGDWDLSKKGKPQRAGSSHHSPHPFPASLDVSHFSSFKVLTVNYDVYYLHLHS